MRQGWIRIDLSAQKCLTHQLLEIIYLLHFLTLFHLLNFDPSPAPVMQRYALRALFLYIYILTVINIPLVLISTCFKLPNEIKRTVDGPTPAFTFNVFSIQNYCIT